jgi:Holliday junction DNA helicase RuvA
MIGFLKGHLLASSPERLLIDIQGVGYEVNIPLSTFYEVERVDPQSEVGLFIHTNVREDALELFGFWTEREKQLFEKLIAVSGIGPKLARVILSGMAPEQLLSALAAGDIARLETIPGIGKKTAQRMVVELKDRVQALASELAGPTAATVAEGDLVQALVSLGYKAGAAQRAVGEAKQENPEAQFSELLRLSLQRLSHV